MAKMTLRKKQKGFALIEVIAVLVILGILAAVAIPKHMDLQDSAITSAAQGSVSEIKGRLSNSYGKLLLQNAGSQPAVTAVFALISTDVGTEFSLTAAVSGTTGIAITVGTVQGKPLTTPAAGYWVMPTT